MNICEELDEETAEKIAEKVSAIEKTMHITNDNTITYSKTYRVSLKDAEAALVEQVAEGYVPNLAKFADYDSASSSDDDDEELI